MAARIGQGASGITADAGDPADVERAVEMVRGAHGRIDALVLNAGISEAAALAEPTVEHVDRHFAVNVRGPVLAMRAATAIMGAGSAAVLVGSIADVLALGPIDWVHEAAWM